MRGETILDIFSKIRSCNQLLLCFICRPFLSLMIFGRYLLPGRHIFVYDRPLVPPLLNYRHLLTARHLLNSRHPLKISIFLVFVGIFFLYRVIVITTHLLITLSFFVNFSCEAFLSISLTCIFMVTLSLNYSVIYFPCPCYDCTLSRLFLYNKPPFLNELYFI